MAVFHLSDQAHPDPRHGQLVVEDVNRLGDGRAGCHGTDPEDEFQRKQRVIYRLRPRADGLILACDRFRPTGRRHDQPISDRLRKVHYLLLFPDEAW